MPSPMYYYLKMPTNNSCVASSHFTTLLVSSQQRLKSACNNHPTAHGTDILSCYSQQMDISGLVTLLTSPLHHHSRSSGRILRISYFSAHIWTYTASQKDVKN